MLTLDQRHYLEEVLGLHSAGYDLPVAGTGPAQTALLVLTAPLSIEERGLFAKIMGAVTLGSYTHLELENISLAEFPEGWQARRVLVFADYPAGRHDFETSSWTVLAPIAAMMGSGAEVAARKKETWAHLQRFAKEET